MKEENQEAQGCTSCSTGGCGDKSKSKCKSGGCNKKNVFDWLGHMSLPADQTFNIVELRFKNGRKEFYKNKQNLHLVSGDLVVVSASSGSHIGRVSLQGELVRLQMMKKKVKERDVEREIYRIAHEKDVDRYEEAKNREMSTLFRTRQIIQDTRLQMKLSDVEYQADNTKATFFYSADNRVDFRQLIKLLASEFRIRVEMKQISLRQEASLLGGIGVCGRELCCSTWLSDFKNVPTSAARYQNLSLNPNKLSGQCGRLKCCLNYELDTYMSALEDIPKITKPIRTASGFAFLRKTDIFKRIMWFGYENENAWHPVPVDKVKEMLKMVADGKTPQTITTVVEVDINAEIEEVLEIDLGMEEFHKKIDDRKNKKRKPKNKRKNVGKTTSNKKAVQKVDQKTDQKTDKSEKVSNKPQFKKNAKKRRYPNKKKKSNTAPKKTVQKKPEQKD